IVRYPPLIQPGSRFLQFILSIDIAPTLIEVGGAKMPAKMHGRSFASLLRAKAYQPRTSFLIEHFSDNVFPRVRNMGYQAVRTERWKYIHYPEIAGADELYDLQSDSYELNNLSTSAAAAG